jgi:hypothetical protein
MIQLFYINFLYPSRHKNKQQQGTCATPAQNMTVEKMERMRDRLEEFAAIPVGSAASCIGPQMRHANNRMGSTTDGKKK